MSKQYTILEKSHILNSTIEIKGTLDDLIDHYQVILKNGFEAWKALKGGRKKINTSPKTIDVLIHNVNAAFQNASNMKNDSYKSVSLLRK